jgi:hypothetical protein
MTARTVKMLLDYIPASKGLHTVSNYQTGLQTDVHDSEIEKFAVAYTDLGIGWKVAKRLAELELPFPCFIEGDDLWLRSAYLYCLNLDLYGCPFIREARYFASDSKYADPLNGLLLSENLTYESIAADFNVPAKTIAAYEKLFFNVMDRHLDHLYIRGVVYPQGRLVEMYENYLENEEFGNILKRVGFNNGREDVLHFAGFRSGLLNSLSGQNMPVKLEGIIMANGYLLAKNGWANQREHATGLTSARNLIAAAKHGGQEQQQESAFVTFGHVLDAELVNMKSVEATSRPILADKLPIT